MERTPPRSVTSRSTLSGFRPVPPPSLGARIRAILTPKRLGLAGAALALGLVAAFFLDTHFPESTKAGGDPGARAAADARLAAMAQASGGLDRLRAAGVVSARITDRWRGPFASLSVWGRSEIAAAFSARAVDARHHAELAFADGVRWSYDGKTAIEGAENTGAERVRVERLSAALSQLLLLPFSAITAGSNAELIAPGVISIRFRHLGTGLRTDEWRLYFDEASSKLTHVVLPLTASDPSPLTRCDVIGWETVDGITLPSGYRCSMANRLAVDLHTLEVSELGFGRDDRAQMPAPPAP